MEQEPQPPKPRIFIASQRCLDAGFVHGEWLDAQRDTLRLAEQVAELFATQPLQPITDEDRFTVFATEGFGKLEVPPDTPLHIINKVARYVPMYDEELAVFVEVLDGDFDHAVENFWPCYVGTVSNLGEAGERLLVYFDLYRKWNELTQDLDHNIRDAVVLDVTELFLRLRRLGMLRMCPVRNEKFALFYLAKLST
jgi:hypothetical protein